MTKSIASLAFLLLLTLCTAHGQSFSCGDPISDIDGNVYSTVEIAGQCWMQENLKTLHCSDGTAIPLNTDSAIWTGLSTPAYTYYDDDPSNVANYGILYNGFAALDSCQICPQGWSIPTDAAWTELVNTLGGEIDAGSALKETTGWTSNTGSTNSSGFTAKPGGFRVANGSFDYLGTQARFWTSTMATATNVWTRVLYFNNSTVGRLNYHKKNGMSIRCVKEIATGLGENEPALDFDIYPNPASQNFIINLGSSDDARITITNMLGETVYAETSSNTQLVQVDLTTLSAGIYVVLVQKSGRAITKKLIVSK